MKVKFADGDEVSVKFAYDIAGEGRHERQITLCRIMRGEQEVAVGSAVQNPMDQFQKSAGRKLSLTRALENAEYPVEKRRTVWNAYFLFCKSEGVTPQASAV